VRRERISERESVRIVFSSHFVSFFAELVEAEERETPFVELEETRREEGGGVSVDESVSDGKKRGRPKKVPRMKPKNKAAGTRRDWVGNPTFVGRETGARFDGFPSVRRWTFSPIF